MDKKVKIIGKVRNWDGSFRDYETTGEIIGKSKDGVVVIEKFRTILIHEPIITEGI